MSLPILIAILAVNFFGILAIIYSLKEEKAKKLLAEQQAKEKEDEQAVARMKEDFTNIIVHELRSPLTSIKASTDLLLKQSALTEDEKAKLLTLISDQSKKLLYEVSLILEAAKLEAGVFTIQKSQEDLKRLIEEKVTVFNTEAQNKFINLVTDIDPALEKFQFDPHHIEQVLCNLIANSLKFTPSGGTIRVTAKQSPGNVIVSVSDTGSGIPKDKQHLLFSKFSQIAAPNAQVGTGLGLYIVKGIIEAHHGTILLESEEGKGTTVTFTLPTETQKHALVTVGSQAIIPAAKHSVH